jgi:hypothetical protein
VAEQGGPHASVEMFIRVRAVTNPIENVCVILGPASALWNRKMVTMNEERGIHVEQRTMKIALDCVLSFLVTDQILW